MAPQASVHNVFDTIYDDSRRRVCALAAGLGEERLATTVPATPDWTARQLVAHLAGVASDLVHGRHDGAGGPEWTSRQVAEREGRALDDLIAEWAQVGPEVRDLIARRRLPLRVVHDVLTHEADLREAFGLGRPPADAVDALLPKAAEPVVKAAGALVVRAGGREWRGADTAPEATLTVDAYELYRGLISRRSRAQMLAWDWTGHAERYVDRLPAFGPRDDDQPVPSIDGTSGTLGQ
jgi:uncharacterized protein (TIGR03083 family)